jgi:hypothetical protein
MSEENVELVRRWYAAYNPAMSARNPQEAIRAVMEPFTDPEIEWEIEPLVLEQRHYHGIDGVMDFFD